LGWRGFIENGKKEGIWEYYSLQGHLLVKGTFFHDIKKGPWIFFFPNGKTKAMGRYENNIPWGEWTYWTENGEESQQNIQQITEDHVPSSATS
jgi:antitoxin component YwqK of YwqJK toxin-antitoxin module